MVEVLSLEQHSDPELFAEPEALGEQRRPAGVVAQDRRQIGTEARIGPGVAEARLELVAGGHERLGDEAATELTEATRLGGLGHQGVGVELRSVGHGQPLGVRGVEIYSSAQS